MPFETLEQIFDIGHIFSIVPATLFIYKVGTLAFTTRLRLGYYTQNEKCTLTSQQFHMFSFNPDALGPLICDMLGTARHRDFVDIYIK